MIRVLLVDDEPQFLELTKYLLERQGGFETEGVISAAAALDMLERRHFDAVVSDYQMPEVDGLQFLKILRNQKIDIPFVLFTGKGREDVAIEALNSGADFYLQKGGEPKAQFAELAHMIATSVDARQAEMDLQESERRFRDMLANVHHVAMILDPEGQITYCNDSLLKTTGWSAPEILGKDYFELFVAPERREEARRKFDRYLSSELSEDPIPILSEVVARDGRRITITWDNTVLRDRTGNPVGTASIGEDVTESLKARADLETQSNLVRLLAENARDLIYRMRLKPDLAFEYVSPASTKLVGYTPEEHYANPELGFMIVYPEDRHILESMRDAPDSFENPPRIRWMRKDGDLIWTEHRLVPVRDENGEVIAIEGIVRDITQEVEAEEELVQSVQRYRNLVDTLPCLVCSLRPSGEILFVNDYAREVTGHEPADMLGFNWWDMLFPGRLREQVDKLLQALAKGDIESDEMSIETRTGEVRILLWSSFNVVRDDAGAIELLNLVGIDITEWRTVEETLSDAEKRYEAIFSAAGNAMAIVDQNLSVSLVNGEFEKLSGYRKEDIEGKMKLTDFVSPPDAAELSALAEAKLEDPSGAPGVLELESLDRFGTEHFLLASASPIDSSKRFVVSFLDQTETKHHEQAIKQVNEKMSLLSRITRHDVLNLLAGLYGYLQIAREAAENPRVASALAKAAVASEAIARHLEFARDYQDMGTRKPMWLDAQAACKRAVADMGAKPFETLVQIHDLEVFADPMLEKVFYNMLQNSAKHGGRVTRVVFRSQIARDGMHIICEDDGVGIPSEHKQRIFERRIDVEGGRMGYGLYLAKEILGITGIMISENGEPGKGARFELTIPRGKYRTKVKGRR